MVANPYYLQCYVRFATPAYADFFVDYFSSHDIAQSSGLDSSGSESSKAEDIIVPEIVLGKREEVYWERIPEKLRRRAVEKSLKAIHGPSDITTGGSSDLVEEVPQGGGGGGRKRRRKAKASE
jgi:hypothetical protein